MTKDQAMRSNVAESLQQILQRSLRHGRFSGVQFAFRELATGSRVDGAIGADLAGSPLVVSSPVSWFCAGKPVVAACAVVLHGHGVVDLDAPMAAYMRCPASISEITPRHLLTHTSGLPNRVPVSWAADSTDWIADLAVPAGRTPGRWAGYNNHVAFMVLEALLRQVTRRSVSELLEESILGDCWSTSMGPPSVADGGPACMLMKGSSSQLADFYAWLLRSAAGRSSALRPSWANWLLTSQRGLLYDNVMGRRLDYSLGLEFNLRDHLRSRVLSASSVGHMASLNGETCGIGLADPVRCLAGSLMFVDMRSGGFLTVRACLDSAVMRFDASAK